MRRGAVGALAVVFLLLFAAGSASSASTVAHAKPRWRVTVAKLPANAATGGKRAGYIDSISCASPGNCSAVGVYLLRPATLYHWAELLLTEKAGHWARGVEAVLPANAKAGPPGDAGPAPPFGLDSVSCASA